MNSPGSDKKAIDTAKITQAQLDATYLVFRNAQDDLATGCGGDYLTARMFIACIREGKQPPHPFDIHGALAMSSVAILAHRSVLNGNQPYDIPDFHDEVCRVQYENDRLSPFYGTDGTAPSIPCCSHPEYKPTERQLELYRELIGLDKK